MFAYNLLLPHILRKPQQVPRKYFRSFFLQPGSHNAKGHGSDEPAIAAGASLEHGTLIWLKKRC